MSDRATGQMTAYEAIGGEATLRRLVARFYVLMDSRPEGAAARAVHPPSLASAEEKLYEYLTGWLGGPPLFTDKYGHPMLRARHLRAPIAGPEIDSWLACFRQAWDETVSDPAVTAAIMPAIERLALHMRNRED